MSATNFAAQLRGAEARLRSVGLSGRAAYAALCRHLARRLEIPPSMWLDGVDAPPEARLDRLELTAELDLFGLAYERFFPDVFKGERGQFFTPRPLVELMADLVELDDRDRVLDPTCGSGGFLVVAHGRGAEVDGIELDPELVALCRLNLKLHGADPRSVRYADFFRDVPGDQWDVILANPPFSLEIRDSTILENFELGGDGSKSLSDILFVEAAHRCLRPGGRLAMVLPHSVLANARFAPVRAWMDAHFVRRAIVGLPEGIFRPFGGAAGRACVISLQKRPAMVSPWISTAIRNPGYDTTRRHYRVRQPDELSLLRIAIRDRTAPKAPVSEKRWNPESMTQESGIAKGVPTTSLGSLVRVESGLISPGREPDTAFTEIDLADVDKSTGEVHRARIRKGSELTGRKCEFDEGDLLFSRMRPQLNNVVIAHRPSDSMPERMCGSSEWVRLVAEEDSDFALLAARSSFVRGQLRATQGQTRPRVQPSELPDIEVPDPGPELRRRLGDLLGVARQQRRDARRRLDKIRDLYEDFGRGEIDVETLRNALSDLSGTGNR